MCHFLSGLLHEHMQPASKLEQHCIRVYSYNLYLYHAIRDANLCTITGSITSRHRLAVHYFERQPSVHYQQQTVI